MTTHTLDAEGLKTRCDICNAPAGLETSPEGQPCDICDAWVDDQCVDYRYLRVLHENATKHGHAFEGTYAICTECSAKARLPNDYPAPAPERDEILVPEWVILQSFRYALTRHSTAVKTTAEHLISIWRTLTKETRSIILRDISEEHALWARQNRQHRSEIDERTWRDTLNQLQRLEDSLAPEHRAHDQHRGW